MARRRRWGWEQQGRWQEEEELGRQAVHAALQVLDAGQMSERRQVHVFARLDDMVCSSFASGTIAWRSACVSTASRSCDRWWPGEQRLTAQLEDVSLQTRYRWQYKTFQRPLLLSLRVPPDKVSVPFLLSCDVSVTVQVTMQPTMTASRFACNMHSTATIVLRVLVVNIIACTQSCQFWGVSETAHGVTE